MSRTAKVLGVLMVVAFLVAAAWPSAQGTLGFGVAGLILFGLFVFVTEDDEKQRRMW